MNKRSVFAVGGVVVVLILAVWYIRANWADFESIRLVNGWYLLAIAVLIGIRMVLKGIFEWQAIRSVGVRVHLWEVLRLSFVGLMMNQVFPLPVGAGYRAVYFRRVHELPYNLFASTAAAFFLYFLVASTALGLAGVLAIALRGDEVSWAAASILGVILIASVSIFFLPESIRGEGRFSKRINRILEGWKMISRSPQLLMTALLVVLGSMLINVVIMFIAFGAFGVDIDVSGALVLMSSQRVGSLVRVTPGAIGVQEAVSVYFATMLSVTAAETIMVLGLMRLMRIAMAIVLGVPSMWLLSRNPLSPEETVGCEQ